MNIHVVELESFAGVRSLMLEMEFAICSFTDLEAGIASAEHVEIVCLCCVELSLVADGTISPRCWAGEQFEIGIGDIGGAY